MSSSSPSDWHFGRLRGVRGARRVWSSDEEEEEEGIQPSMDSRVKSTSPPLKQAGTLIKTELASKSAPEVRPAYASTIPSTTARLVPREEMSPESGQVRLQVQMTDAAAEFKAQAAEWQELLHMAKGELNSLCRTVKNERESTTQKVVQQRDELDKMFESVQRTNSAPMLGAPMSRRNLGEDVAHISGGMSASKVCDVVNSLVWKMEESLTFKIGYIGGVFHSWRCEVALGRAGGAMDHQRQVFQAQKEKIMRQWYEGDAKGLIDMTWREWIKYMNQEKNSKARSEQVKMVCAKWMMGTQKALFTMSFKGWVEQANAARKQREIEAARAEWESMHAKELADKDAAMQQKILDWEKRNARAKKDLYLVFAKWEKGKTKGALLGSFQAWRDYIVTQKATEKRKVQMKEMMYQWFEGQAKGLKRSCFQEWSSISKGNKAARDAENEKKKLEELLNGELAKKEQEAQNEAQRKKESARLAVEIVVRKWEMGSKKGVLVEVFGVWSKYAMKWNQIRKSKADAQIALAKFLEGDKRGVLHTCWLHWKAEMQDVHAVRQKEKEQEEERKNFNNFLDQQHREWQMSAEEARKEAGMKAVQIILKKWLGGEKKGLLIMVYSSWQEFVKKQIAADQQYQAVKLAVMKWVEGDKKALFQTCFLNWHKEVQREAIARASEALANQVQHLEGRLELHISHAKTRLLKYFAKLADGSAMLEIIIAQWHAFSQGEKGNEAQRLLELQLQEQERQHKLKEAESKELILSALENLGCKSPKTILMKHWYGWVQFYEQARIEKEQKMKKNEALTSLGQYMESKSATANRKELLTLCFKEWVHDMHLSRIEAHQNEIDTHRGLTSKLEQERAQLVEQLSMVYHQLDQVTETLQKELKTKEELALELREANEQMRKSHLECGVAGGYYIDVQAILKTQTSRGPSRATSPGSAIYGEKNLQRQDSDGSFNFGGRTTPRQKKIVSSSGTSVPPLPGGSTSFTSSSKYAVESPAVASKTQSSIYGSAYGKEDSPDSFGTKGTITPRGAKKGVTSNRATTPSSIKSGDSPDSVNWDHAISRMRDEGRFRAGEAPRF